MIEKIPKFVLNKKFILTVGILLAFVFGSLIISFSNIITLVKFSLFCTVPIALPAIGEVLNQRGGLFNVGLEGTLLMTACVAVAITEIAESWVIGLLAATGAGALISFIFGYISTYGKGSQLIAGVGINLLGAGLVAYSIWQYWGSPGHHLLTPRELAIPKLATPWGPFNWFILIPIIAAFGVYYLLDKTGFGVRLRAAGHNPFVTDASGINVYKYRIIASTIGGALTGLGGAYLSIAWLRVITNELSAGRGFIALACVVFSGLDPFLALGGAVLFASFWGFSIWLATQPWAMSIMERGFYNFFHMLPYIAVLIILAIFVGKRRFPKSIGKPYRREE